MNWTYRRKQIEAAEAKWATTLTTAGQALGDAEASLATASREVLEAWDAQASCLTGASWAELRLLARSAPTPS